MFIMQGLIKTTRAVTDVTLWHKITIVNPQNQTICLLKRMEC